MCPHWQILHTWAPPQPTAHMALSLSVSFALDFHCNRISWAFYISFSCAADVLKAAQSKREREVLEQLLVNQQQPATSSHSCIFLLFSFHVSSRRFTSTPLRPQGDGWLLLLQIEPKGNRANGPAVLRGLRPEAVCPCQFRLNLNGMFLWWALSDLVSMSYTLSWSKLSPVPENWERSTYKNRWMELSVVAAGERDFFFTTSCGFLKNSNKFYMFEWTKGLKQNPCTKFNISFVYIPLPKSPTVLECEGKAIWSPSVFAAL